MGLLLDDDCHVTPHCDCRTGFNWGTDISPTVGVFCEDKFLTRVPSFRNVSYRMTQPWTIDLQSNSISYIPGNAFSNLQEYGNGNNVYVKLGINNLRNISDSAFSGIEPFIIFVGLDENQLQYIPSFVSKLPNLKGLNILYNPIVHIDPLIFISIHRSLETLKISVGDLPAWPQTLNVLANLESLVIQMKHYEIPTNAFKGLNGTLRRVTILDAGLMDTAAVCSLGLLESLEVSYRRNIHDISGKNIVNCTLPMNSTKDIKINYSTYEQLPIVFRSFPNLESLAYFNSSTRFIDDSLIPAGARVKVFKCMYCKFLSVPGAINLFHFLEYCLLQENGITTVERFSFDNQ